MSEERALKLWAKGAGEFFLIIAASPLILAVIILEAVAFGLICGPIIAATRDSQKRPKWVESWRESR